MRSVRAERHSSVCEYLQPPWSWHVYIMSPLFWDVMLHLWVIGAHRSEAAWWSHFQGSRLCIYISLTSSPQDSAFNPSKVNNSSVRHKKYGNSGRDTHTIIWTSASVCCISCIQLFWIEEVYFTNKDVIILHSFYDWSHAYLSITTFTIDVCWLLAKTCSC